MHELGVVMAVCEQVIDFAQRNNVSSVAEIVLEIGEGSGIIADYVREVYPAAVHDTVLADTKLLIEVIPGMAMCESCHEIYNVVACEGHCPACGSQEKEILSGREFSIKEIHVYDDAPPDTAG